MSIIHSARRARILILMSAITMSAVAPVMAQNAGVFENLQLFVGPDGSKQPQDLGINASMGIRFSANWGFPVVPSLKIGGQIGAACNLSDGAVHVLDQVQGTKNRTQTYLTGGVFSRTGHRFNWGLAYDALLERYYDKFRLGQLRGQAGYDVTDANELGVWFTKGARGDYGHMGTTPVRLDPISQGNAYWSHTWPNHAETAAWAGVASGHASVVWVLPNDSRNEHVFVYGSELNMPLNERFAITGAANFLTPTATGTVDAYLGVTYYPAGTAMQSRRNRFAPITAVANNPTFAVDLRR